jgi:hypothetical protein
MVSKDGCFFDAIAHGTPQPQPVAPVKQRAEARSLRFNFSPPGSNSIRPRRLPASAATFSRRPAPMARCSAPSWGSIRSPHCPRQPLQRCRPLPHSVFQSGQRSVLRQHRLHLPRIGSVAAGPLCPHLRQGLVWSLTARHVGAAEGTANLSPDYMVWNDGNQQWGDGGFPNARLTVYGLPIPEPGAACLLAASAVLTSRKRQRVAWRHSGLSSCLPHRDLSR